MCDNTATTDGAQADWGFACLVEVPAGRVLFDTADGAVVLTGCAHPGIVRMVERAREAATANPSWVLGGLHLLRSSQGRVTEVIADLEAQGVSRAGATHCSGEEAVAAFRRAFGPRFVDMGVGANVELAAPALDTGSDPRSNPGPPALR